jgi:hypothetical protein
MRKPCLDCGALSPNTRCPTHTRAKSRARGTTTARGYGHQHQQRKAQDEATTLPTDPCPKCGLPLGPPPWDQGHTDDRLDYQGPTHPACNRDTARRRS